MFARAYHLLILVLLTCPPLRGQEEREVFPMGPWIWAEETKDRQEVRFVRRFRIPEGAEVESARLRITADNSYTLFLDGQEIGRGGDWRVFIEYDITPFLTTRDHTLGVSAVNDFDLAGLILGLRVEMKDRPPLEIVSDRNWRLVPINEEDWLKKDRKWPDAPQATELLNFPAAPPFEVYHAPVSIPREVKFWERKAFQLSVLLTALVAVPIVIGLALRLLLQSYRDRVMRRERARLAADLHDGLGGGLTQLVLMGESSSREVSGNDEAAGLMREMSEHTRLLMRQMNETVWLINSERDTFRDIASYVVKHAETFFQNTSVRCRFDIEDDLPALPCDLGTRRNLFLAVKEALTNVLRHSGATVAEVAIRRDRGEFEVRVSDNGGGLHPPGGAPVTGNGLRNMRSRMAEAGGGFEILSPAEGGTAVIFRVPFQPAVAKGLRRLGRLFTWKRSRDSPV